MAGLGDPQTEGPRVGDQYHLSVRACCALGRTFEQAGYDVVICDVGKKAFLARSSFCTPFVASSATSRCRI